MPGSGGSRPRPSCKTDDDWAPSSYGGTRCTGILKHGDRKGKRCGQWAVLGQKRCLKHGARKNKLGRYRFKSKALNAVLDMNLKEEDYLSTREELALMRTALSSAVRKMVAKGKDLDELSFDQVELLDKWVTTVTKVADITNRIERGLRHHITIDSLVRTMSDISEVVLKHCSPEVAALICEEIESVAIPTGESQGLTSGD